MSSNYADFYREPSKPHQCMYHSEKDGTRCRAIAMHGEMMCYHHRPDVLLPVIENEPFLLEALDTRADIQRALGQVAHLIACNRMDFQKAKLLLQTLTAAMRNLPPHPRPARAGAPLPAPSLPKGSTAPPCPIHPANIVTAGDDTGRPVLTPLGRDEVSLPSTGCPVLTPLGRDEVSLPGCPIHDGNIVMSGDNSAGYPIPTPSAQDSGCPIRDGNIVTAGDDTGCPVLTPLGREEVSLSSDGYPRPANSPLFAPLDPDLLPDQPGCPDLASLAQNQDDDDDPLTLNAAAARQPKAPIHPRQLTAHSS